MSENANLQDADGKKEVEETKVEATPEQTESTEPTTEDENSSETSEPEVKEEEAHVEEVENSNAEDAEDESNAERHNLEDKDYHSMPMESLVTEFEKLLKNHKIQTISSHVNEIKSEFKSKYSALLEEKKEEFVNDGGNEIDFYYSNDI